MDNRYNIGTKLTYPQIPRAEVAVQEPGEHLAKNPSIVMSDISDPNHRDEQCKDEPQEILVLNIDILKLILREIPLRWLDDIAAVPHAAIVRELPQTEHSSRRVDHCQKRKEKLSNWTIKTNGQPDHLADNRNIWPPKQ